MFFVLSLVGRDREGLVARYTDHLHRAGANLLAGHGRQLGRTFAFDTLFQIDHADGLKAGIDAALADAAPRLVEVPPPAAARSPAALHYVVSLLSEDATGIVSKLTGALSAHGAAVVSLACNTFPAPTTGVNLFEAVVRADVPNSAAARALRDEFAELERHFGWEIEFEPDALAEERVPAPAPYPPSAGQRGEDATPWADAGGPWQWGALGTLSPDRPGIVAATARFLTQRGAGIHAQAARRVGGLFASHTLFHAADADLTRIRAEYAEELAEFQPVLAEAPPPPPARDDLRLHLTLHAADEPGILAAVTKPIAAAGAAVASLSFGQYPRLDAPRGTPLFVAELGLLARDAVASRHIAAELLKLEREHGWEIDYRPEKRAGAG